MWIIVVAAIAIGLGAAGVATGLPRLAGRRAPRWVGPVAAGLAMLAFMLWNEYTWYARTLAALPSSVVVAETYPHRSVFQPWTLAVPRVARFAAVDRGADGPAPEGLVRADVVLAARFQGVLRLPHLFDCAGGRRAPVPASGLPEQTDALEWSAPDPAPLIAAACAAGQGDRAHGQIRPAG